jgi:hypothetical protein
MKHTPGPWKFRYDTYGKSSEIDGKSEQLAEPVCIVPHDDITTMGVREMKANARLICAAPDLLSMVRELVEVYWGEGDSDPQNPPDIINRANALLKKVSA